MVVNIRMQPAQVGALVFVVFYLSFFCSFRCVYANNIYASFVSNDLVGEYILDVDGKKQPDLRIVNKESAKKIAQVLYIHNVFWAKLRNLVFEPGAFQAMADEFLALWQDRLRIKKFIAMTRSVPGREANNCNLMVAAKDIVTVLDALATGRETNKSATLISTIRNRLNQSKQDFKPEEIRAVLFKWDELDCIERALSPGGLMEQVSFSMDGSSIDGHDFISGYSRFKNSHITALHGLVKLNLEGSLCEIDTDFIRFDQDGKVEIDCDGDEGFGGFDKLGEYYEGHQELDRRLAKNIAHFLYWYKVKKVELRNFIFKPGSFHLIASALGVMKEDVRLDIDGSKIDGNDFIFGIKNFFNRTSLIKGMVNISINGLSCAIDVGLIGKDIDIDHMICALHFRARLINELLATVTDATLVQRLLGSNKNVTVCDFYNLVLELINENNAARVMLTSTQLGLLNKIKIAHEELEKIVKNLKAVQRAKMEEKWAKLADQKEGRGVGQTMASATASVLMGQKSGEKIEAIDGVVPNGVPAIPAAITENVSKSVVKEGNAKQVEMKNSGESDGDGSVDEEINKMVQQFIDGFFTREEIDALEAMSEQEKTQAYINIVGCAMDGSFEDENQFTREQIAVVQEFKKKYIKILDACPIYSKLDQLLRTGCIEKEMVPVLLSLKDNLDCLSRELLINISTDAEREQIDSMSDDQKLKCYNATIACAVDGVLERDLDLTDKDKALIVKIKHDYAKVEQFFKEHPDLHKDSLNSNALVASSLCHSKVVAGANDIVVSVVSTPTVGTFFGSLVNKLKFW